MKLNSEKDARIKKKLPAIKEVTWANHNGMNCANNLSAFTETFSQTSCMHCSLLFPNSPLGFFFEPPPSEKLEIIITETISEIVLLTRRIRIKEGNPQLLG